MENTLKEDKRIWIMRQGYFAVFCQLTKILLISAKLATVYFDWGMCAFVPILGFAGTSRRVSCRRRVGRRRWAGWWWSRPPGPGTWRSWAWWRTQIGGPAPPGNGTPPASRCNLEEMRTLFFTRKTVDTWLWDIFAKSVQFVLLQEQWVAEGHHDISMALYFYRALKNRVHKLIDNLSNSFRKKNLSKCPNPNPNFRFSFILLLLLNLLELYFLHQTLFHISSLYQ